MVCRLIYALAVAVSGTLLIPSLARAQGRPMRFAGAQRGMTIHFGPGGGRGRGARVFRRGRRGRFIGPGYLAYPYLYTGEGEYEGSPQPPSPPAQIVVIPPPAPPAAPPAPPPASLTMEYRDGHWVRVPTGNEVPTSVSRIQNASTASRVARAFEEETAKPAPPLPHAVLVFRDGRKLELQRYEVRNGFIYATGDYWNTGSPARKIAISELNVPATLRLNRQLGSKFSLPSNPDEVVVSF